jgi:hypothetical protein
MAGVPTGAASGFIVFDLDPAPGQDAAELLEQLRVRVGGKLPAALIAHTPRGGMHLMYAEPADVAIGNRANIFKADKGAGQIDVRGTGGYVIFAPSQRRGPQAVRDGCDGRFYQWDEVEGPGEDFALSGMTPAMIDLITGKDTSSSVPPAPENVATGSKAEKPASRPAGSLADRRKRAAASKAFDAEIADLTRTSSGGRNQQLNIAAMKLGQLVAAGVLSKTMVESALEAACHSNGLIKDDGLNSVRATIASGMAKGLSEPRDLSYIERDAAEKEYAPRRDARPRPPAESENAASRRIAAKPEDFFSLPTCGRIGFAWHNADGMRWLCTAEQKTTRDKETGEDRIWTAHEKVSTPFQVDAWLHLIAGTEKATGLRIALIDPKTGELSTVDIRRSQLSGRLSGTVLERLYDAGLQIEQEKIVAQILRSMRPDKEIAILPCTSWHELPDMPGEPVFALPNGEILGPSKNRDIEMELDKSVAIPAADARRGSLQGWLKGIEAVFGDDRVPHLQLGTMAGFAGPVLTLAGLDSCGLVWTGLTSGGKTTAQKLAVSAWSRQEISKPGLMKSAHTTLNAVEGLLANANGTLLALDELALCDGKQIGKLIFEIASGRGKERMNSDGTMRQSRSWQTFVTLSSEQSLEKRVIDDGGVYTEGAALRILDIDVSSLDKSPKPELFQQIELIEQNYGHAGPAFVQGMMSKGLHSRGEELRRRIIDAAQTLAHGEPGEREDEASPSPALIRAAQPLAIVQVAAELAQEFGLIPRQADCAKVVQWAWDRFREASDRLVRTPEERAIEALSLFIAQRWDVSIRAIDASRPANREAEGWYDDDAIYIPAGLLSPAAGNILKQKPLAKILKEKGLLARTEGDHSTVRVRSGKRFLRIYALAREAFSSKPPEKPVPQSSLPYKED